MKADPQPSAESHPRDDVTTAATRTVPATSMSERVEAARTRWREAIGDRGSHPCPHCNETFMRPGYLDLHLGRRHAERRTPQERARYETAVDAERQVMHEVALHTKSGLFALPLFLVWAATLVLLIELETNVAWALMSTPGYVFFAALIYVMAYGYQTGGREHYHGRE